jgi:hypothetical protein
MRAADRSEEVILLSARRAILRVKPHFPKKLWRRPSPPRRQSARPEIGYYIYGYGHLK